MTTVLVTGASGALGRQLVPRLRTAGHAVRAMSRRAHVPADGVEWVRADLATGRGVAESVRGAEIVVHCASRPIGSAVDVAGTRRLLDASRASGVRHLVYISIVGIERIPFSYYWNKVKAEAAIERSGVPATILRATQFHELLDRVLRGIAWSPVWCLPTDFRFQPIDAGEVADRLVECVAHGPSGRRPDVGGPEVHRAGDLVREWLRVRGKRRAVIRAPIPGAAAHGFREGYNTCPGARAGTTTWLEWLGRRYGPAARSPRAQNP